MSTLAYSSRARHPLEAAAEAMPARTPFWSRLFNAFVQAQQRRAEREVARYLASRGHVLNDAAEREIMRRLAGRSSV
jgi:hypothetical protein